MRLLSIFIMELTLVSCASAQQLGSSGPDDDSRYIIQDDVLIKTMSGATLSATVIRLKSLTHPAPTLLTVDIYTRPALFLVRGKEAAARGYVSVTADVRGKRLSTDDIVPYEHDAEDSYEVIDWIVHQPWSDGKVGMWGGSYSGFSAWAATKRLHPALKTIAVTAAAIPGFGLPMNNNVFLNANYGWAFYVTNNKYLDETTNNDALRWRNLQRNWFSGGGSYREIDRTDGTSNPLLQRWLNHPAYDTYWQNMVPYEMEFAAINIPVLTITGYYDDGQISALHYLKMHNRYNHKAEHYLVIGPYDHLGSQAATKPPVLRDYKIDLVAHYSTKELTYAWMDYVLRSGKKPALLKDKINYEVMGANVWRSAPSLEKLGDKREVYYFTDDKEGDRYKLSRRRPAAPGFALQEIDYSNRNIFHNYHSYPYPIIQDKLDYITELMFVSEQLDRPRVISGAFVGELGITINKRDVDLGVTVFEQMPDGKLFHLGYWIGRASFAYDGSVRKLLTPGEKTRIPFETTLVSRQLSKGSRLLFLLDVNKNPTAQVNYGTGKDVSDESVVDAKEPLELRWHNDSYVRVPLER